ncbi:MAG TPA: LytTR family DNA-binding domain-containing protein [Opitutaceae bacterium]|jgi:two-component system LytT family response regulator
MTKLRILIADDEPLARSRLLSLLPKDVDLEVIGEYANGNDASEAIRRDKPDIAFLDMQMPGCDGLKVVESIDESERPAVVFVTAHDKFAVDAFGVRAVDYVLKPFDRERLETALGRAAEQVASRQSAVAAPREEGAQARPERLAVKADGRFVFLRFDEIAWIEAADNYVVVHTMSGERYMPRDTLTAIEARLGPKQFARVNRSALVRVDQVKELHHTAQGDYSVILRNGTRVSLSRSLRGRLEKFLL